MVAHTPPNAKYVGTEGECDGEFLWGGGGGGGVWGGGGGGGGGGGQEIF